MKNIGTTSISATKTKKKQKKKEIEWRKQKLYMRVRAIETILHLSIEKYI